MDLEQFIQGLMFAEQLSQQNRYAESLGLCLQLAQSTQDPALQSLALSFSVQPLMMMDRLAEALQAATQSVDLAQRARNPQASAQALLLRGLVQFRLDQLQEALASFDLAEALYQQVQDKQGRAHSILKRGEVQFRLDQLQEALASFDLAEALYQQVQDKQGRAHSILKRGEVQFRLDQLQGALASFDQAEALYQQVQSNLGRAHSIRNRGEVQVRLDQLQEALASFDLAEALYQQVQDKQGRANSILNKGEVQVRLDQLQEALASFDLAESLYHEVQDNLGCANSILNMGLVQVRLDQHQEALASFDLAEALYQHVQDNLGRANSILNRGQIQVLFYQLQEALASFDLAEALYQQVQDKQGRANSILTRGQVQVLLSQYQEALASFDLAEALYHQFQDNIGRANSILIRGQVQVLLSQHQEALASFDLAEALYQQVQDKQGRANSILNRGQVQVLLYQFQEALASFDQAEALYQQVQSNLGRAHSILNKGEVLLRQGQDGQAEEAFGEALGMYEEASDYTGPALVNQARGRAWVERANAAQGDERLRCMSEAVPHLERACEGAEALAARAGGLELRRRALEGASGNHRRLHKAHGVLGQYGEALGVMERMQAQTSRLLSLEVRSQRPDRITEQEWLQWLALRQELRAVVPEIFEGSVLPIADPPQHDGLRAAPVPAPRPRDQRTLEAEQLSARIAQALHPSDSGEMLELLRRVTPTDGVVLWLHHNLEGGRVGLVASWQQGQRVVWAELALTAGEVGQDVNALLNLAPGGAGFSHDKGAWDAVVGPMSGRLLDAPWEQVHALSGGAQVQAGYSLRGFLEALRAPDGEGTMPALVFVASGLFHLLPWSALHVGGTHAQPVYLVERFEPSVAPSLSLLDLCNQHAEAQGPALVVCDPSHQLQGAGRLPFTPLECDVVAEVLAHQGQGVERHGVQAKVKDARAFLPFEPDDLARVAGCYALLHLSCHGSASPKSPFDSALLLSGQDKASAEVSVQALAEVCLAEGATCVVSACQSGMNLDVWLSLDDPLTVASVLIARGAKRVIASLWSVNDLATSRLMQQAYRARFERGLSWGKALNQAQRMMLDGELSPTYQELEEHLRQDSGAGVGAARPRPKRPEPTEEPLKVADYASPFYWAAFQLHGASELGAASGEALPSPPPKR